VCVGIEGMNNVEKRNESTRRVTAKSIGKQIERRQSGTISQWLQSHS
jgi:hypothetical protein